MMELGLKMIAKVWVGKVKIAVIASKLEEVKNPYVIPYPLYRQKMMIESVSTYQRKDFRIGDSET